MGNHEIGEYFELLLSGLCPRKSLQTGASGGVQVWAYFNRRPFRRDRRRLKLVVSGAALQ